jgi:hypothetical protein
MPRLIADSLGSKIIAIVLDYKPKIIKGKKLPLPLFIKKRG